MSIKVLPQSTIRLITTSQIITSVSTAVKELMENAIDAKATCIQISLMNQGLDLIEVKDDGSGIPAEDVPLICQAATTSKITDITDLDSLSSYGFRGEALNALCQIGELSVTTKSSSDPVATQYKMSHTGGVISTQPSHFPNGTTISVKNLFNNLPVRKQYLCSKSRMSEELRKVERVVKSLALIHCKLRVTLSHNKCMIWQKNQVCNLRLSLSQVIPLSIVNNMEEIQYDSPVQAAKINLILPKKTVKDVSALCMSNMQHAYFLYVNKRSVRIGKIEKMLSKEFTDCFRSLIPNNKYPVCLLSLEVPSNAVDVNLEPNKTKVLLKDVDELVDCIRNQMSEYYYDPGENQNEMKPIKPNNSNQMKPGVKRKVPDSPNEENSPRKVCKSVDMNITYEESNMNITYEESNMNWTHEELHSGNIGEARNDGGFMNVAEMTLSQLPRLLESKENLSNSAISIGSNRTLGSESFVDKTSFNETDFVDKLVDNSYNSNVDSIEVTNSNTLPVLDDILPYDSYSESCVTNVKQQSDSAYSSEGNPLDAVYSLEIYEKDVKNDITATQWSKGNVIIHNKLLDEPTYVPIHAVQENQSSETPSIREYTVKIEGHVRQENRLTELAFIQGDTEMANTSCIADGESSISDNTLYFQSSNQEQSLNQSEASGESKSKELDNFTLFTNEIRKDILENKAGSFSQVASQLVAKSSSLRDSQCNKGKQTKPNAKKDSVAKPNKSMLEFVNKKLIRSYPCDEAISFNMEEVKLKLLEKSSGNTSADVESNETSEESESDDITHASNSLESGTSVSDSDLDERWNQLIEMIGNEAEESFVQTKDVEELINVENGLNSSNDSSFVNSILLKTHRFRVIGMTDKNWFYAYRKSLGVLDAEHLYKLVTFHKHLRTYQLPCVDLEDCTLLDKHFLHTVLSLDLRVKRVKSSDRNVTLVKIDDKLFTINGVGLLLRKNHSKNELSALLTQAPEKIPSFSSKDATELVKLATLSKSLEACRPGKVQKLIQNVTEEFCTKHPLRHSKEVISELMVYWFEHIRSSKCPLLYARKVMFELCEIPQTM